MSGRYSEAAAAAEQALAVYRQPAMHAELLRGNAPLPSGVATLLRLAGGTEVQDLDPVLAALAPEGELRKAALFFVEEILFQREATHYRVLGLDRGATADQIKEHHRLLMRLFHPDRSTHSGERREHFATRANLAYNVLRDGAARASYDEMLRPLQPARMQALQRPPAMVRRTAREPDSYWAMQVHPNLMRHLPQWVLAGTALVSVTVVGAIYLFNPPVNMQNVESVSSREHVAARPATMPAVAGGWAEAPAANEVPQDDETGARFERRLAGARQPVDEVTAAAPKLPVPQPVYNSRTIADAGVPKFLPAPPPHQKPAAAAPSAITLATKTRSDIAVAVKPIPAAPTGNVQKTVPATPVESPVVVQKPAPAAPPVTAQQPAIASTAAATMPAVPAEQTTASPKPALPDPNTLLAKFLEAYEQGDMQTCMALLDNSMRGKPELRREYDALFRGTDLRHIKILNINWSREGESIRGEGQYHSTVMRKGESVLRSQNGQIRVELVRRGSTVLINDLQYIAGSHS